LDQTAQRLSDRDKSLFAKIIEAYSKHDAQRANVLASELAEIRKTQKTVMHARLALEQIVLRLKTVTELGDMVGALAPIVGVLRTIKGSIAGVLPDAGKELEQIGTMLNGIIMDAGQTTGLTLNFDTANEDARSILTEAATVAEQKMKDQFPELPSAMPVSANKAEGKT
jgi:division protein CdvB (Snf7/Vps24/ESCRT-III family)